MARAVKFRLQLFAACCAPRRLVTRGCHAVAIPGEGDRHMNTPVATRRAETPQSATAGAGAVARAQQRAASAVPAPPPGPHRLFLGLLPFAVAVAIAAIDI